jgi:methyl-accepting chemotaxis protein
VKVFSMLRRYSQMSVSRQLNVSFACLMLLLLMQAGIGVWSIAWMKSWQGSFDRTSTKVEAANNVVISVTSMGYYALMLTLQPSQSQVASYSDSLTKYETMGENAIKTLKNSGERDASFAIVQKVFPHYDEVVRQVANDYNYAASGAAAVTAKAQMLPLARDMNAAADKYMAAVHAQQQKNMDALSGITLTLIIAQVAIVVAALAAGVGLSMRVSRSVTRQLREAVNSINTSAAELLAVASQVAAGAAQTSASTNQTTVTVEEVKQTAQLAHEKALQVAENSQALASIAEGGRAVSSEVVSGVERMQSEMGVVSEAINRLSEQAGAVGDIIATVNDLAEQSNLLSVNASIEAAKAGEQGRGFTVVAQEVKSMAEQSKQAVAQVRTILNEIEKAARVAVEAAEKSREAVEAGKQMSLDSVEGIDTLAATAIEAAQASTQISASARQQLAGMEQISQAIQSINEASAQAVSGTRQVEQEVRQLQGLAVRLEQLVAGANA